MSMATEAYHSKSVPPPPPPPPISPVIYLGPLDEKASAILTVNE